ncbi:MAG: hypothetical protein EA344_03555, partial [Alkalicoccus sp.]
RKLHFNSACRGGDFRLELTLCGIFQSPSSTGRFPLRFCRISDVLLFFMISYYSCRKTGAKVIFRDACGKRKREDPPGRQGSRMLSPRQVK